MFLLLCRTVDFSMFCSLTTPDINLVILLLYSFVRVVLCGLRSRVCHTRLLSSDTSFRQPFFVITAGLATLGSGIHWQLQMVTDRLVKGQLGLNECFLGHQEVLPCCCQRKPTKPCEQELHPPRNVPAGPPLSCLAFLTTFRRDEKIIMCMLVGLPKHFLSWAQVAHSLP